MGGQDGEEYRREYAALEDSIPTHLLIFVDRCSENIKFKVANTMANQASIVDTTYFLNDAGVNNLLQLGKLLSPWLHGLNDRLGWCPEYGTPFADGTTAQKDVPLTELVVEPTGGAFKMEKRVFVSIWGTLCDGPGGQGRFASLHPMTSLQHHAPPAFPRMKGAMTFPGETGTARVQCTSQSYIKYKAGHGVPLGSLLMSVAFSMYAMYGDILGSSAGVVVFVGKRPDRIVNPMVVCSAPPLRGAFPLTFPSSVPGVRNVLRICLRI
jgi:hypothetical protein